MKTAAHQWLNLSLVIVSIMGVPIAGICIFLAIQDVAISHAVTPNWPVWGLLWGMVLMTAELAVIGLSLGTWASKRLTERQAASMQESIIRFRKLRKELEQDQRKFLRYVVSTYGLGQTR